MRSALLVLVAALVWALAATPARADTKVIDAVDTNASQFQPPNVTINVGDSVRWEFDQAATSHTVTSSSSNWTLDETHAPNSAPITKTFDTPGVYSFLCKIHSGMTGSVTVQAAGGNTLSKVLVFSKTAAFRHDSIPQGIAMVQALGAANGFSVDATEDSTKFTEANLAQYDVVIFPSTTGDILNDTQQTAFEHYIEAGGGYVGIHAAADTEYTWPWPGRCSAATSATTRPARRPRPSTSRTPTSPPPPAFRTRGRAWTSGTTSSRRPARWS